ncbi:MAG: nucleoside-diphosphate-sugar pyrophosphorylase [Bryobacteraceae bacterium]|jgi:NDP-sugar pyrophosphorylase family protein|nr:MAG: nucleoside-diphosphate-sugar pyrophosphorylase [Bryobacteraceae bacterium]
MSDRAVVLAGGQGTRLRPYTIVLPKPLMPVCEYPILEVVVRQLIRHGFRRITMAVNHQAELIRAFFGGGEKWGVAIDYSLENQPLSTMGPLRLIPDLPDHFLVMNGDVLSDLDLRAFLDAHVREGRCFTIAASRRRQVIDYGVLHVDDSGILRGFEEKPATTYMVSMGIYAVSRRALEFIPAGVRYGFDHLMRDMLAAGQPVHVYEHQGYWRDIGRPDDYMQAIEEFEGPMRQALLP